MEPLQFQRNRRPSAIGQIPVFFGFVLILLIVLPSAKSWAAGPTINVQPGFTSQNVQDAPNPYLLEHQGAQPGQVREIAPMHSTPTEEIPRIWTPPPILGCWSKTIRRADLTSVVQTGAQALGGWFDETYRICFAAYPHGPLVPTVTSSDDSLAYKSSQTSVTGWGNRHATLKNVVIYDDPTARAHPVLALIARLLVRPCTLVQTTDLKCALDGGNLRVQASASATCNGEPAYKISWNARFERNQR